MKRALAAAVAVLVALACGGPGTVPPSSAPDDLLLRARLIREVEPEGVFDFLPTAAVTRDLTLIVPTRPDAETVPVYFPLVERPIEQASYDSVVSRARELGLLGGNGDFRASEMIAGDLVAVVELVIDGERFELRGDPGSYLDCQAPDCNPPPGTPHAFTRFWNDLMTALVAATAREEALPHEPAAFALLIGTGRSHTGGPGSGIRTWPLSAPLAETGAATTPAIGSEPVPRCATVRDTDDVAALRTAFAEADAKTLWVDAGAEQGSAFPVKVRPLLPGEDACREVFGIKP